MKRIIQAALAATLIAGVTAQAHQHQHRHLHKKHDHSPVEKRETATAVVPGPTVVEYVLDGKTVAAPQAQQGISDGLYVVVGETTPTFVAPPRPSSTSSSTTTAAASSSAVAEFFEKLSTSSSSSTTPSPTPTPSATKVSSSTAASDTVGAGIDTDFPSGQIPCSTFPSDYGAVAVDYLGTGGWTSLQRPTSYTPGEAIADIIEAVTGGCSEGMFCSYACPAGYEKTQWPSSQGATGQSVGGLYCNSNGYLELTRTSHPKICEPGAGGVYIVNKLSQQVSVCRTDYPGSESMVIPLVTSPGGTYPLTNPVESEYYTWEGKQTSAQYYVNNQGVSVEQACVWDSTLFPSSAGNWAPVNIGVGQDSTGTTYISIFPNSPTSSATLNFNIVISGSVSSTCYLKNGVYSGNNGCTTALTGGSAYITFSN